MKPDIAARKKESASAQTDNLYRAQTEIRHLKSMIAEMREKLEETQAGRNDAVQATVAARSDEIRQLQETIQTLRERLEALQAEKDAAVQAVRAAAHDETRQLQATIAELREKLEQARR